MFNDIQIGPVMIHMYGLMIAIGFMSALLVSSVRAKRRELDGDVIYGIFWCAIIGGALGTRILYYIVSWKDILEDPSILWNFKNGYVVYGGILGGIFASYLYCKAKKVAFIRYFDLVMPSVALAQGFGRLGCFFAGCCYGRETTGKFAIVFSHSDFAPNNVPLIPTQLMSSAGDFCIAAVLYLIAGKKRKDGMIASMYLIFYSIGRFIIEIFRADYRGSIGVLSTSQFIAILLFVLGSVLFFFSARGKFAAKGIVED